MATLVTLFKSTDSGAPSMTGQVGKLTDLLSHCLIIGKVFTTTDDVAFTDNTTEARLNGGTAFKLFITPATTDRAYFGHSSKFTRLTFAFGTLGTSATYVWEYWNGTAWTTLSVTDGTSSFTVNGSVTWAAPGAWATNAVNSVTQYWVRVRYTGSAPATNPLTNSATYLGWLEYYTGTNQRDYRAGVGRQLYLSVNDNTVGAGGAKEARASGFEAMTALGVGTGQFPTAAQVATFLTWRKSFTADATARTWLCIADDRSFIFGILTGDTAGQYYEGHFGDLYALLSSDAYGVLIVGREVENDATSQNFGLLASLGTTSAGHYMPRSYTAVGTSVKVGKHGDAVKGNATSMRGTVPYLNGPDGIAYTSPIWVHESGSHLRGRIRGLREWLHAISALNDLDTFSGTGTLAAKTFVFAKQLSDGVSAMVLESSDGWETN